jgi:hypothetical protein
MDREGSVRPSVERKAGEPRQYTEDDAIAMHLYRRACGKELIPGHQDILELVAMVQRGNRAEMKRAEIRVYQPKSGFAFFVWLKDVKNKKRLSMHTGFVRGICPEAKLLSRQPLYDIVELYRKAFRAGIAASRVNLPPDPVDELRIPISRKA